MRMVSLSLTSMVDMFAILVIFLLASSSSTTEWIKLSHGVDLPKAKSSYIPPKAAAIQVARDMIYADEKVLLSVASASQSMEPLRKWLAKIEKRSGYINLVAHQKTPYGLIKKIIAACQDAGFNNVNLAIQPKI